MSAVIEGGCRAIPMESVRSLMFVPADRRDFLKGIMRFAPDGIVFDLQDSVAPARKALARKELESVRPTVLGTSWDSPMRPYLSVRINPIQGGEGAEALEGQLEADVEAVLRSGVDGLVVPEVRSVDDVLAVDRQVTAAIGGSRPGGAGDARRPELLVLFETPESIDLVDEIVALRTDSRIGALLYGREDLTDHMGVPIRYAVGWDEPGTLYARSRLIWAAKRRHLPVLDSTPVVLRDEAIIGYESQSGRDLGFTGRACIHPAQIPVIDRAYAPSPDEVTRSTDIVASYEAAVAAGGAVVVVDGALVDRPIAILHEKLLARAESYRRQDAQKQAWKARVGREESTSGRAV